MAPQTPVNLTQQMSNILSIMTQTNIMPNYILQQSPVRCADGKSNLLLTYKTVYNTIFLCYNFKKLLQNIFGVSAHY